MYLGESTTMELDALKRNIEQILFNHLLEDLKTGIRKMFKAYKTIESKPDSAFTTKTRKQELDDVSMNFISTFFNQKIGDFANNFKELFIDRGSKEDQLFTKRSQEILLDCLDYYCVQFLEYTVEGASEQAKVSIEIIAQQLNLFPNLFSPLFKMYFSSIISHKVKKSIKKYRIK